MKAILPRQEFSDALSAIGGLTSQRSPKPILSCVKITASDESVEVVATDGEVALRLSLAALSVKRPGTVVAPADRLAAIIRELPDAEVALEVSDRYCVIRGHGCEFRIFTAEEADFPPVAEFSNESDMTVDVRALRHMIDLTLYAAARETTRYAINGVLWERHGKKLYLVATDGRRLARAGGAVLEASSGDFEAILPGRALQTFLRVFSGREDGQALQVKVTPNQVLMQTDDRLLSCVLVEGHFPRYQEVIPKEHNKVARIGREEFMSAVRRAALLTTEDSRAVRLAFGGGQLVITSQSAEQGEARVELPIKYEGEDVKIGFNPVFLNDALKVLNVDEVVIEMLEDSKPGVLTGGDRADFLYVVMPVTL